MSIHRRWSLLTALLSMSVLLEGCTTSEETVRYEADKTYKLTVLYTNDNNGHFWKNEEGEGEGEGGMAARKTIIDSIRTEVKNDGRIVLIFSAGGVNKGVPESDLQSAIPDFLGMNLMGYDAWQSAAMNSITLKGFCKCNKTSPPFLFSLAIFMTLKPGIQGLTL